MNLKTKDIYLKEENILQLGNSATIDKKTGYPTKLNKRNAYIKILQISTNYKNVHSSTTLCYYDFAKDKNENDNKNPANEPCRDLYFGICRM